MEQEHEDMADEAVDHIARQLAQDAKHQSDRALDRIDATHEMTKQNAAQQRSFEVEMRASVRDLHDRQIANYDKMHDDLHTKTAELHDRISSLIRAVAFGASGIIATGVIALFVVLFKMNGVG